MNFNGMTDDEARAAFAAAIRKAGADIKAIKAIKAAYDARSAVHETPTETAQEIPASSEEIEAKIAAASHQAANLPGVRALVRSGSWMWLHIETAHTAPEKGLSPAESEYRALIRKQLKAAGFQFASQKTRQLAEAGKYEVPVSVWYYNPEPKKRRRGRGKMSEDEIKSKYGAVVLR
jgi:DNA-binding transcriptional MerR regulator